MFHPLGVSLRPSSFDIRDALEHTANPIKNPDLESRPGLFERANRLLFHKEERLLRVEKAGNDAGDGNDAEEGREDYAELTVSTDEVDAVPDVGYGGKTGLEDDAEAHGVEDGRDEGGEGEGREDGDGIGEHRHED